MRIDDVLKRLPKLPNYGYALLGGLSALVTVAVMMMCVVAALLSMSPAIATPTPTLAPVTTSSCTDPNAPDVNWQLEGSMCAVREEQMQGEASYTLEMAYPADLAQHNVAKTTMLNTLNVMRSEFWGAVPAAPVEGFGPYPWTLQVVPQTFGHSPDIVSVLFTISTYMGGAHPNGYFATSTFDLAQERTLSLADLFQEGVDPYTVLSPLARADLNTALPDMADFVNPGTEPTAENFANWILTPDALVLYFPPYQVAPYAAGPQTVTIPLTDLSASLKPEFVPGI